MLSQEDVCHQNEEDLSSCKWQTRYSRPTLLLETSKKGDKIILGRKWWAKIRERTRTQRDENSSSGHFGSGRFFQPGRSSWEITCFGWPPRDREQKSESRSGQSKDSGKPSPALAWYPEKLYPSRKTSHPEIRLSLLQIARSPRHQGKTKSSLEDNSTLASNYFLKI